MVNRYLLCGLVSLNQCGGTSLPMNLISIVALQSARNCFAWDSCMNAIPCKSCAEVFIVASCLELFSILRQVDDFTEALPYERDFAFEFHLFPLLCSLGKALNGAYKVSLIDSIKVSLIQLSIHQQDFRWYQRDSHIYSRM